MLVETPRANYRNRPINDARFMHYAFQIRRTFTVLPLTLPAVSLRTASSAMLPVDRHVGRKLGHVDLADLRAVEARFAGQRAQHVAGTDLLLAAAEDLQRRHGRQQRLAGVAGVSSASGCHSDFAALHLLDAGRRGPSRPCWPG